MKLFGLTIFLGAFLLFQIQPLMAKFILRWFGGGPGVWTICLLFFQTFLLAGYAYAHGLTQYFSRRVQAGIHATLLLAALAFLPVMPGAHWKPAMDGDPTWRIFLLLTVCLGVPYFALAATGPLLQAWFSRLRPGVVPYRLYALSNLGSLLALISYPFVFEPVLTRRTQAGLWAWSFGTFAVLCGTCTWQLWRAKLMCGPVGKTSESKCGSAEGPPPTAAMKAWWFALPACASVLLLATTNKLCLDVASVPFLWLLPLSLYLLSFVICFDRPAWYARKLFTLLLLPLLVLFCYALAKGYDLSLGRHIVIYGGNLFAGCMVCHGELYRLKPAPRFLTSFYLFIAAGGAAGGVFVGILSPVLFDSYAELNWGFWLLSVLVLGLHFREKTEARLRHRRWRLWPVLLAGVLVLGGRLLYQSRRDARDTISTIRNFYGVLRLMVSGSGTKFLHYQLYHGTISHGLQFADPSLSRLATTYYNEPSGVGLALNNFPRQTNRCVGVVGLGTGTLAVYGRPGDTFRFYEINPDVRELANVAFSFLRDSAARVEVIPGDARLSLEREAPQQFDLLVLDAFNSDAVPTHLLTREAFTTYFQHLKPDGVIAVHISNRHLNLLPVMVRMGEQFQCLVINITWHGQSGTGFSPSSWVILSRNQPFMLSQPLLSHAALIPYEYGTNHILWTDDYTSLFSIIKR